MSTESPQPQPKLGPPIDIFEVALFGPGRYRLWIIPCAVIGLVIGFGQAILNQAHYNSTAKIHISWGQRETWGTAEQLLAGGGGGGGGGRGRKGGGGFNMAKELQFMKNNQFFERIAREVGSDRLAERYDPLRYDTPNTPKFLHWQHLLQDWWFYGNRERDPLRQAPKLDLDTQKGINAARSIIQRRLRMRGRGNVLQVAANASSPELAQDIVAAAVKVILQRHYEIFDERFNPDFVTALRDEATEKYELVSEEYYKHQQDCGFYNIASQRGTLLKQRVALEESVTNKEIRLEEIEREKEYLRDQLAVTPEREEITKETREIVNPAIKQYTRQIEKLRENLSKLELTFLPDSPILLKQKESLEKRITLLEDQLSKTPPFIEKGYAYSYEGFNKEYRDLEKKLEKLDVERDKILAGIERNENRLETIRDTLAAIVACEPRHQEMQEVIRTNRSKAATYDRALDKRQSIKVMDVEESMGNIWVLQHPSFDPAPRAARRSQTVLQGLGIGVGVAIALGVLRQLLDQRLRYPFAVQRILGAPVLGVVPEERGWKRITQKMRKQEAAAGT